MIEQKKIENAKAMNLIEILMSKGIAVKKQGQQYMALCPFHDDHEPSLSIDTKTNLFKCFSCGASGDSIRFIELYEKKTFPEAVQTLTGANQPADPGANPQQLLNRIAAFYHEVFSANPKPQEYLKSRGIIKPEIYQSFTIGYADGKLLGTLPKEGPIIETLKKIGLLNQYGKEHFLGCVTFPLFDASGNTLGIYGRRIENGPVNHLYLPGKRRGIFNRPAAASSDEIIVTESIIDALSLYQNGYPNTIPLYGTNGFTDDHLELFQINRPKKIHLCLNNDEPGRQAAAKLAETLKTAGFNVGIIQLTEHKDLNDYFNAGKTFDDFTKVLITAESTDTETGYQIEQQDNGLILTCETRQYRIRGISLHSFERLRVNIKATQGPALYIDSLDLYQNKARKNFAGQLVKLFKIDPGVIEADLLYLINQVESYQARLLAAENQPQAKETPAMSKAEEDAALEFLKRPDLMDKIIEDLETVGHVGEETRKLLAYLIAVSRKLERPLSGIIMSQSGAGKSGLVEKIQELVPPEEVEFFSRITPQALYYMERDALKRKLLIIEERTGGEGADYSIRTLQSRQKLTQAVPIKDPNSGKIKTMTFEVEGPIAYLETTASAEINHENATRCFEIYLDESIEQTRRIHQAQREAKSLTGIARKARVEAVKQLHHNAQRLLKTMPVFNPYAVLLDFPADVLRTRRDHERFLSLIEAVAFLHQYQRPVTEIDGGDGPIRCIESTLKDYEIAYQLAKEILGFTLDDLKKHARDLLDLTCEMVRQKGAATGEPEVEITFTRREIREFSSWPDHQLKNYIRQLEDLEYLILEQVKKRGQFEYRLNSPENRRPLKGLLTPSELEKLLSGQTPS